MELSDLVILTEAVFFAGMGALAVVRPRRILQIFQVAVESVEGRNEVAAVYGGFGLAIAGILVYATRAEDGVRTGILIAVCAGLFGMAGGRILRALVERPGGFHPVGSFLLLEAILAAGLAWVVVG